MECEKGTHARRERERSTLREGAIVKGVGNRNNAKLTLLLVLLDGVQGLIAKEARELARSIKERAW